VLIAVEHRLEMELIRGFHLASFKWSGFFGKAVNEYARINGSILRDPTQARWISNFLENSHPIGSFPRRPARPQARMAVDLVRAEKLGVSDVTRGLLVSLNGLYRRPGRGPEVFSAPRPVPGSDLNSGGELSR